MTREPHEDGWRALAEGLVAELADAAEPSELTDRRIRNEALRIAAQRRAQAVPAWRRRVPMALAASVALVAIGVGVVLVQDRAGPADAKGRAGDLVVAADAGATGRAPVQAQVAVPLQFAADGVTLQPGDLDQLGIAVSQNDPCARGVTLQLATADAARAAPRAAAVAAALRQLTGDRCRPAVVPGPARRDPGGAATVLVISAPDQR